MAERQKPMNGVKKRLSRANTVDCIKLLCCVLIIGSHCIPIFKNKICNYYYGQWLFRFCVPFFFISSGYFFSKMKLNVQKSYIKRIALIYLIATTIYIPVFIKPSLLSISYNLIFGYYHLWYLSALAIGLIIISVADKLLKSRKYYLILMLVWGVMLDEYYKLFDNVVLDKAADIVVFVGGARHAIFFAVPMLLIGSLIASCEERLRQQLRRTYMGICALLFVLGFIEATLLKNFIGLYITSDITFFGWTPAVPLFLLGLRTESKLSAEMSRRLRKITDVVYIIHVWVIIILQRVTGFELAVQFLMVVFVSFIIAFVLVLLIEKQRAIFQKV